MMNQIRDWQPPNVTCTGYLTGRSLREIYASSDMFIFP